MSAANTSWETPKTQCIGRNPWYSSDDQASKYHHSIENLTLNITQVVSESTQVCDQMLATNSTLKTDESQYFE